MITVRNITRLALPTLAMILLLAACAEMPRRDAPLKRFYVLEAARPGQPVSARAEGVLKVRTFRIAPRYDDKEMVLKTGPGRFESDYYNLFFAPVGPMLTSETAKYLAASGVFADVVDPASRMEQNYTLEGNITALHGDYSQPGQPRAVLEMQFLLLRHTPSGTVIDFHRDYRREIPLAGTGADRLTAGLDTALNAILGGLSADLASR